MGIHVADVGQLAIAATACQKRIEGCLQLREIQRLVKNNLLPFRLKLLGTVLLRYLPQQFEPRILYTVSVNILNINHELLLYFVSVLIVMIVAYFYILKDSDGIVGERSKTEILSEQIRSHTKLVETHQSG